jgi:hypothetical protein
MGCVDDRFVAVGNSKDGGQCGFYKGKLLFVEFARIKASLLIEREDGKRSPNHAGRLSANEFDNDVGHAHSLSRENREAMACRVLEHPVKRGVRQAIEGIVHGDEVPLE